MLDLSHNNIGPDGTTALALANGIEFFYCTTEAIGMMVLTLADGVFKIFTALQELNLSHNKSVLMVSML